MPEMDLKDFCASIVSLLVGAFPLMEYFFSTSHLLASGMFQLPNPSYVSKKAASSFLPYRSHLN
jgi:hypothetical protein